MDPENFKEYFTNLKIMKNKEKDTNKEKIFMLEILQDLLDKDIYKVEYENFNKRILELTIKDKEITEEINVFDNILRHIQLMKTHSKPSDGKKKRSKRKKY
jgi:hypothetical protein